MQVSIPTIDTSMILGDGDGDRDVLDGAYLEHLNESNTEVEVHEVTADQTQAEEDTDGDDGTEVDPAGHLNSLASIEKGGIAGKQLRRDGCEGQMVGGQNDRVS